MCAEAKTNRVSLVSPDLNTIEQLLDELRDRSVQPRNLRQLQVALHLVWVWIPKNVVRRHMHLVRPRYEAVIAAGEGHVCFLDELKISELIKTRTSYSLSSEKFVIFENGPLSKHWRIA